MAGSWEGRVLPTSAAGTGQLAVLGVPGGAIWRPFSEKLAALK